MTKAKDIYRKTKWNSKLSDDDWDLFWHIAEAKELDPLQNEIYASAFYDKHNRVHRMTVITQIDGYRKIARRDRLAGIDDAVFDDEDDGGLTRATVTVYRWSEYEVPQKESYTATARWSEYFPGEKQGMMWKKMPHTMLAKCAEALALRKGFQGLSGVYIKEEMDQAQPSNGGAPGDNHSERAAQESFDNKPPKSTKRQQDFIRDLHTEICDICKEHQINAPTLPKLAAEAWRSLDTRPQNINTCDVAQAKLLIDLLMARRDEMKKVDPGPPDGEGYQQVFE